MKNDLLLEKYLLTYLIAVHTAFYHSYSVEASNSLTSFVYFRFKDSFLKKKVGAIHIYGFTKLCLS